MTDTRTPSSSFCRMLDHGLTWNNNEDHFSVAPCCYFGKNYRINLDQDVPLQLLSHRQRWQQEDFSQTCRQCLDQETAGEISYRQSSFDTVAPDAEHITFVTVAVNKQCNLACASCGPDLSSFWYQQNRRDGQAQPLKIHRMHQQDRGPETVEKFISIFDLAQLDGMTYIKFGGGEPLMSTIHKKILEAVKSPAMVTVQYTSNFSIEPSAEVMALWQRFRLIKWCASIDAVDDQFETLRWPHKWQDLQDMISRMKHKVPGNVMFGVEHTLNPLNVWYYDRFHSWFQKHLSHNRFGDPTDLNMHRCVGHLDLDQTPPRLRLAMANRLGTDNRAVRFLAQYPYRGRHDSMVAWMDDLDRRRDTQWRQIFAEVAGYFA